MWHGGNGYDLLSRFYIKRTMLSIGVVFDDIVICTFTKSYLLGFGKACCFQKINHVFAIPN